MIDPSPILRRLSGPPRHEVIGLTRFDRICIGAAWLIAAYFVLQLVRA